MSVLNRLAHAQNRRDEAPNQELARQLAENRNQAEVQELAENLWHRDPHIQADCLKVLYEIGYLAPELIAPYAGEFVRLLHSRDNRLVWGGMIALSTIADLAAVEIDAQRSEILKAMQTGSVITMDAGVLTLAKLAASSPTRGREILPYLLEHLKTCRLKDVPQHAEKILLAVDAEGRNDFVRVLEARLGNMTPAQALRVRRVIQRAEKDKE